MIIFYNLLHENSSMSPIIKFRNCVIKYFIFALIWITREAQHISWKWSSSVMSDSLRPLWTVAYQAPLSVGFSRQGYWSGLPFPSPRIFPTQGSNMSLLHCRQTIYHLSHQGSHLELTFSFQIMASFIIGFKSLSIVTHW